MKIMKCILMSIVLLFTTVSIQAQSSVDVSGQYYCNGYDPYVNANYTTHISIKKAGRSYAVMWDLGHGDLYAGAGMLNYDSTTFSVLFYKDQSNVRNAGLAVYQISSNRLKGEWVMSEAANKVGFEDCVRRA